MTEIEMYSKMRLFLKRDVCKKANVIENDFTVCKITQPLADKLNLMSVSKMCTNGLYLAPYSKTDVTSGSQDDRCQIIIMGAPCSSTDNLNERALKLLETYFM